MYLTRWVEQRSSSRIGTSSENVDRSKSYAQSKFTTRSIALASLLPIALQVTDVLWRRYQAEQEQRQALID
jgi:hypothetical protein